MPIAIGIFATGLLLFAISKLFVPPITIIGGLEAYMKARILHNKGVHSVVYESAVIPDTNVFLSTDIIKKLDLELTGQPCNNTTVCYRDNATGFTFNCSSNSFFQRLETFLGENDDINCIETFKSLLISTPMS